MIKRLTVALAAGTLAAVLLLTTALPVPVARAAVDRLPDLRVARVYNYTIQTTSTGHRLLRFTTRLVNLGKGPFEVRGSRPSTAQTYMTVSQRIYNDAGGYRTVPTPAVMRWSGDGHDHWHAQRIASYALRPVNAPTATPRRGAKVGFCFFDTDAYWLAYPGASQVKRYYQSGCGTRSSLRTTMGISVGWADKYPYNIAYQWIDITGLRSGDYKVCVTVDPSNWFPEISQGNNYAWSDIRISGTGSTVTVLRWGLDWCRQ